MMGEELTQQDKAILLGNLDGRSRDDYDQHFYEAMNKIPPLGIEEIDDRVRRAILRFIMDGKDESIKEYFGGYVMLAFAHGYMVGRKLRRDIRRK